MLIKVFEISSLSLPEDEEKVNAFLRTHKVLKIEKEFFSHEGEGRWSLFVSYLGNGDSSSTREHDERRAKIDYKQVLGEDEFVRFARLREIRKKLAADDAVPAYAVFTDAELSQMSKLETLAPGELRKINGVGEKRVEKYGVKLCEMYNIEQPNQ